MKILLWVLYTVYHGTARETKSRVRVVRIMLDACHSD